MKHRLGRRVHHVSGRCMGSLVAVGDLPGTAMERLVFRGQGEVSALFGKAHKAFTRKTLSFSTFVPESTDRTLKPRTPFYPVMGARYRDKAAEQEERLIKPLG